MTPGSQAFITTPASTMEALKHKVLSALYSGEKPRTLRCYHAVLERVRHKALSETDEKHLRQVQQAVKRIHLPAGPELAEKKTSPLLDIYTALQTLLRDHARQRRPRYLGYDAWETRLDLAPWQMDRLFETAVTFQLTSGCSNFCRRCNEWALPRIRGHFTREAATKIIRMLLARGNRDLALYGGSDPLDWEDEDATLETLLADTDGDARFSLLTKVPRGRETRLKNLVRQGIDLAVSLTNRNRDRIEAIEKDLGQTLTKQHATPDLLIPACLDEDFTTVKPSITDSYGAELSLDGAAIIIPTFTSALYPFGHKKIPVLRQTQWFPVKKLGRPALLQDYFKPLQVIGRDGKARYLDRLLDVQVENILLDNGAYDLTPPGMRSAKEYFEVFEEEARRKRRVNTPSVMKRLKRNMETPYARLSPGEKTRYREKIAAHLDFTRKHQVLRARRSAASFFLAAARDYLNANPVKAEIMAFLTRNEYDTRRHQDHGSTPLALAFSAPDQDAWELFRQQCLLLIHAPDRALVAAFIASCPAVYDPERDLFVSAG
jgi:hypothetical protein